MAVRGRWSLHPLNPEDQHPLMRIQQHAPGTCRLQRYSGLYLSWLRHAWSSRFQLPCRELNPHPRWMAFSPQKRNWIQSNETQHWDAGQSILSAIPDLLPTSRCFFLSFLSSSLPRALKLPEHLHAASPALADSRRLTCISSSRLDRRHPTFLLLVTAVCALAAGVDSHLPALL